jgi:two-component system cell cycle sensor histidine kinase/response regulator CckA
MAGCPPVNQAAQVMWFVKRPVVSAILLLGATTGIVAVELVTGERSAADIGAVTALAVLTTVVFLALRRSAAGLHISLGVRNELRQRLAQQRAVALLGQDALGDMSAQDLLDSACAALAGGLGTEFAAILELGAAGPEFVIRSVVGWQDDLAGTIVPSGSASHSGFTVATAQPVIMVDSSSEERFALSVGMAAAGIRSGLSAQIGSNGGTYGVLSAHTRELRTFSVDDVSFVRAVANVVATAQHRRRAETEAEQTHRVLEAVIEGTNDDIFVKDVEGRFIALNAAAARTLGRPVSELVGRLPREVLPASLAARFAETDKLTLERGTVETFEETVVIGDTTRVWLTTKGPYRARDGTLLGTFGIAHDITVRKAQENALARSEERFRLAQEGARIGTWDVDVATGMTTWSDGLRALCGFGPDHPAGLDGLEPLLHPDDRERVRGAAEEAYRDGIPLELEYRVMRPDGKVQWILGRSASLYADGKLVRVLGVAVDITAKKLADEELQRSRAALELAQLAAGLGTWEWDVQTGALSWTDGVYEILGVDPAEFAPSAETLARQIHPDDVGALHLAAKRLFASDDGYYEVPCRVIRPSGEVRWLLSRGTVVRDESGRVTQVIGVTLDETDRHEAEEERAQLELRLARAEKLEAVGRLAGGVAHDFNNLLVAIQGYGELALRRLDPSSGVVADHIGAMLAAGDRAAGLTKQLLAFGRRQILNTEVIDLNEVVAEIGSLLERVIGDNVELVTVLTDDAVVVSADRGQLDQVLVNLAVNARDAMKDGGVLTVRASTDGDRAVLSVSDEGTGIDPATADHMFEPFFTTKGDEGTGLGLATVYGIVAQSGGEIVLDTELGVGSTFTVFLPLCDLELEERVVSPSPEGVYGEETVLVVEDDPAVRSIVSAMLEERGYEVVTESSGEEAVERFRKDPSSIAIVVSDLMMRGIDGNETLERIREIDPEMHGLFMSGYTDAPVLADLRTGFIQKPFSGDELALSVRRQLDATNLLA